MHLDQFPSPTEHVRNLGVVVVRIVMEEEELLDAGEHGEGDGVVDAAVAPADALVVFGVVVLGIDDEDVGLVQELGELEVLLAGVTEGFDALLFGFGDLRVHALEGLVVWEEGDGTGAGEEAVTAAETGVIGEGGLHQDTADAELGLAEFADVDVAGHFAEGDREVRAFHLGGEGGQEAAAGPFVAEDPHLVVRVVGRNEERESLDMIPVGVGDEDGDVERLVLEFPGEGESQATDAAAGVEDDDLTVGAEFDAGGVAAVENGAGSWRGNGSADTPEAEEGRFVFGERGGGGAGNAGAGRGESDFSLVGGSSLEDGKEEGLGVGFDQVTIGAGFEGVVAVVGVGAAAGGDDDGLLAEAVAVTPDAPADLETVDLGHGEVANDELRLVLEGVGDAFFAVGGFQNSPAAAEQPTVDLLAQIRVAVDEEHRLHW